LARSEPARSRKRVGTTLSVSSRAVKGSSAGGSLRNCDVLVLAAGLGKRMGVPKAAMMVCGRPWCHLQRERLERVGIPTLWVISPEVAGALLKAGALGGLQTTLGDARVPMFHSLLVGLSIVFSRARARGKGGVFVLPVDVPAPAPEVWRRLCSVDGVGVPAHGGVRGHPVFLTWKWVAKFIESGPESSPGTGGPRLDTLIAPDVTLVEVEDPDVAVNLNTPEDVAAWLARQSGAEETA